MDKLQRSNFVNCLSGYKSANLVGTTDGRIENLAVISSVVHIGANPPFLGMVLRPHTVPRHTLENIKQTGQYTINAIDASWYEKAHQTAARYPKEVSEFDAVALTPWYSQGLIAPYVCESKIKIGLQVAEITPIHCNNTQLVVGKIDEVYVDAHAIAEDGMLDLPVMDIACISGLDTYHRPQMLARLSYAKPDTPTKRLSANS
ncbi:flavin reductase [Aestuariibacter sp. A3R04]|nr:flavin reductase [Aestuariibacter sp. A3R04]